MRFYKITGPEGDVIHVWVEDECPPSIVGQIERIMDNYPIGYTVKRRFYVQEKRSK